MSEQIQSQEQQSVNKPKSSSDSDWAYFFQFVFVFLFLIMFIWGAFFILGLFLTSSVYFQEPKCAFRICIDLPKR